MLILAHEQVFIRVHPALLVTSLTLPELNCPVSSCVFCSISTVVALWEFKSILPVSDFLLLLRKFVSLTQGIVLLLQRVLYFGFNLATTPMVI